jgi:hypothetical protein
MMSTKDTSKAPERANEWSESKRMGALKVIVTGARGDRRAWLLSGFEKT